MANLNDMFHAIANWHNKITIAAGCTKEFLKARPLDTLTKEELKTQQKKLVDLLNKIEDDAITASQKVTELKNVVYKTIDPAKEEV